MSSDPSRQPAPWVTRLADLMDSRFRVPGTSIRFGLDPIIGLLPIAGDTLTLIIGLMIVREAIRLRLGARVIGRMLVNLVIDWVLGLIPGLDLVLDTAFKAHQRNAKLLHEHADDGPATSRSTRLMEPGGIEPPVLYHISHCCVMR